MIKLAVAGFPISHSLSPLLHSTAYKILGVDADFSSAEISEDKLSEFNTKFSNKECRAILKVNTTKFRTGNQKTGYELVDLVDI